jgi:hypothetical protein
LFTVDDPLIDSFESRVRKTWMKRYEITEQNISQAIALRDKGYSDSALIAFLGISNIADDCLMEVLELLIDNPER